MCLGMSKPDDRRVAARVVFDRGTLLLEDLPAGLEPGGLPGVRWDDRVGAWRAPARWRAALVQALAARGVAVAPWAPPEVPRSGWRPVPLRPYQEDALSAWTAAGRRGVVVLPTGAGKTQVGIAAIAAAGAPAIVLAPTRVLVDQWVARLGAAYGGVVGQISDGRRDPRPITVATLEGARRHMAWLGPRWELVVVDEAHHVGGGAVDEALELSPAPWRLGLTATPPAPGPGSIGAERLEALVGPTVFQLGVDDLAGGWLAPYDVVTLPLDLEPDERAEHDRLRRTYTAVARPFFQAHPDARWVDFVREAGRTPAGRTALSAWRRGRDLLSLTRAKARAVTELLELHRDRKALVFVADNLAAYALARTNLVAPITCDIGRPEREELLAAFGRGELRALASARVLDEGVDVPDAEVGIVVGAGAGARQHVQRVGRLLRPGPGKRARVYELVTPGSVEVRHVERRRRGLGAA